MMNVSVYISPHGDANGFTHIDITLMSIIQEEVLAAPAKREQLVNAVSHRWVVAVVLITYPW